MPYEGVDLGQDWLAFDIYEQTRGDDTVEVDENANVIVSKSNGSLYRASKLYEEVTGKRISREGLRLKIARIKELNGPSYEIYDTFTYRLACILVRKHKQTKLRYIQKRPLSWFKNKKQIGKKYLEEIAEVKSKIDSGEIVPRKRRND